VVDVLWANAGAGEPGRLGEITEEQFDVAFSVKARGTLFTVQKALHHARHADDGRGADPGDEGAVRISDPAAGDGPP
jgi:NAD(P)-dependent dehydrogenase (short-subunit alcohol dehydrogenase family)